MGKIIRLSIFSFLLIGLSSCARQAPNDYLYINVPKGLTAAEVQGVLVKAANENGWTVQLKEQGILSASYSLPPSEIGITINYTATNYSLIYDYSPINNPLRGTVTPAYNQVLYSLDSQIQKDFKAYIAAKNEN